MLSEFNLVTPVALPSHSGIAHIYKSVNLADAFAIRLPADASSDPDLLARFIFSHQPSWIGRLTKVRDTIVACFGLKTAKHLASLANDAKANRVGIFKIYSTHETEIVLGEDDTHLDFRVSVLCSAGPSSGSSRQLIVSTVVHCHNRLGRAYIFIIAPFHRLVVKASLLRAARIGWPPAASA
ncbi:MAG: hypothetical protein A3I66_20700 [Burkholderiales bacterium RIFCSPLOWO2_02_FULL_57_36]|nr:MAG: hypothetical protein A3I66_20700 [Burkholderiales bacterium RIFCSPLOWO2_02_FULL_57_36]